MIKLLYLFTYAVTGAILAEIMPPPDESMAGEQWAAFILWVMLMFIIATIGVVAFKSVWLQDGFSGLNKILEDHEALKFLAAIMSFIFLEIFVGLIATEFSGKYPHPSYQLYLSFSGCVGTGSYAIAERVMKAFKIKTETA